MSDEAKDTSGGACKGGRYIRLMAERSGAGAPVPAILLAAITLAVFWILQDYGPESAIRRFHQAAITGDRDTLQGVSLHRIESPAVQELENDVRTLLRGGGAYRILRMDRGPRRVSAEVVYGRPGSPVVIPMIWFVDKPEGHRSWRVNAPAIIAFRRQVFGI
jgi:hypothetical protein